MTQTYAPGPWRRTNLTIHTTRASAGDTYAIARVLALPETSAFDSEAQVAATADLMAAAPEMYEALKRCIEFHVWEATEGGVTPEHLVATFTRARAAIAKAAGREP